MSDKRAVVLASGGMDSATAGAVAQANGYDLSMLHTSYGQQTEAKEYECAKAQAEHFDASFQQLSTDHLSTIGSSRLTDDDLIVSDADTESDAVPSSYVPFRNRSSSGRKPISQSAVSHSACRTN